MSNKFLVHVTIGIGAWKVNKVVSLCAAPHINDGIDVDGVHIYCDNVIIGKDAILVRQNIHFSSEDDLEEYLTKGWTR